MPKKNGSGTKLTNKSDIYLAGDLGEVIYAGNGHDHVTGGAGNDEIDGGNGKDTLCGAEGDDVLNGGNGKDRLNGGLGNDSLSGGNGKDCLKGGAGDDTITGGNGKDVIRGGADSDTMTGGRGSDNFIWRSVDVTFPLTSVEGDPTIIKDPDVFYAWQRAVADGGTVGVTDDYPNDVNGSLLLQADDALNDDNYVAQATYKWDSEAGLDGVDAGDDSDDTTLGSLSALGFEWYRDSASDSVDSPVLQLLVDVDGDLVTTDDQLVLTYDPVANGGTDVEDAWNGVSLDFTDLTTISFNFDGQTKTLDEIVNSGVLLTSGDTLTKDSAVYGVQVSLEGATDDFSGAADNVELGFHSDTPEVWNFEVAPPDVITDFRTNLDNLDFTDILVGYDAGVDDINDFIQATDDGFGNTVVSVSNDGSGDHWVDVVILQNATVNLATDIIA